MRDHNDELILRYLLENVHYLHGGIGVERAGRLVGQENIRIIDERTGNGNALHLAAGHLVRLLLKLIAEADLFQRLSRAAAALLWCNAGERERQLDVCEHRLMRDEVIRLEHEAYRVVAVAVPVGVGIIFCGAPVYDQVAGAVLVKPADNVQKRGLAAAGMTQYCDEFVLAELKVHALQRMDNGIAHGVIFFDVYKFQHSDPFQ